MRTNVGPDIDFNWPKLKRWIDMASANAVVTRVNSETARYCYLDFDLCQHRAKLALAAAFVDATDSRYGFSSKDLLALGGSELARVADLLSTDHEWSSKLHSLVDQVVVEVRPPAAGNRIVVRLHWEMAPLACENFATLCDNGSQQHVVPTQKNKSSSLAVAAAAAPIGTSGKPLTYRNSAVHRIVPGFVVQGGDFVFGNGSGGESIYNGKKFKDERAGLLKRHNQRGILSMGNSGKNSNSSQWFITLDAAPQCDGKHVVFGQVVSGWEVLDAIEALGSTNDDDDDFGGEPKYGAAAATTTCCRVTDCGLWQPLVTAGAGFWMDAPDSDSYTGISSMFVPRPRVAIVAPTTAVCDRFGTALRPYCLVTNIAINDNHEAMAETISCLLADFAIDVVLVAPSCTQAMARVQLPASWAAAAAEPMDRSSVILESKPVDALDVVRTKSWLARQLL
jgi:peptidylprolyl isomerase